MKTTIELDDGDSALVVRFTPEGKPVFDLYIPSRDEEENLKPEEIVVFYAAMRISDPLFVEEAANWLDARSAEIKES